MGELEDAVRADVEALGAFTGVQRSRYESAVIAARLLDRGARGMGAAALLRELRSTLTELMEAADRGDASSEIIRGLSAPVSHAAGRPAKPGASGGGRGPASGATADALAERRTRYSARG